ncbi:hypothetical protein B0H10DRAFT_1852028 [Mycena sp. CBHHK59/15]|nr:hypothetical protein B0H10DRAFT_1852028 [Mycena sp. CBHHK59/15]
MARSAFILVLPTILFVVSRAANDWTKPCFNGECSYDIPESAEVSGTLRIWGAADAISDITLAAGWTILDCDKGAMAQDVRLVCHDTSGCPHLDQNTGAVGKLVRLPENCGQSAFARVTRDWVHKNQTLPVELAKTLSRRDGVLPQVKGLSIDTDFSAADVPPAGPVSFAIHGLTSSVPASNPPQRRSRFAPRTVTERSVISVLQQAFQEFNSFNQASIYSLDTILCSSSLLNIKKTFNVLKEQISCPALGRFPAFDASVTADVDACVVANITLAVSAVGTVIPANFTKLGVVVGLDANLEGTLKVASSASATLDSGTIDLFSIGIPAEKVTRILSIGPTFKIQGDVSAKLDVDLDLEVDLSYCISNAKLFYPPSPFNTPSGKFTPNNSPLNLSVSPALASSATLEVHIIPRLDFGITAIGGVATATVFVDFDTSSSLTLSLDASASGSGNISTSGVTVSNKTSTSVDGCVDIGAGLAINAGATGEFFGLFDVNPQANLFTKNFDFFKKCFGSQTSNASSTGKRDVESLSLSESTSVPQRYGYRPRGLRKRASALTCPTAGPSKVVSVADSVVSSARCGAPMYPWCHHSDLFVLSIKLTNNTSAA